LGPRSLQRDLIRDAERGIVAYANPILREISGGELELRLLEVGDDEPDHALPLEAIERVHGRTGARGVEYLSGSQKFRVAVSLALAIGQYARGSKERPIESVIIDEGFGSLDRHGRDEMIEHLNALRGRLSRIILVSHQEEFAEAFRDGYHFEVVEGSTRARPFHR
jgi:DNA repair exonuclease SbcCD ATPase subunit